MPTTYLFVDEAGRSRIKAGRNADQPFFIVGVLLTNDPMELLAAVNRARAAHHFDHEIHWTKQGGLRNRVYMEVVGEIRKVPHWEYKAIRVPVNGFDLSYYDGRDHLAYNYIVRMGIDSALRYPRISIHDDLEITIDAKSRLGVDNCLAYLEDQYSMPRLRLIGGEKVLTERTVVAREIDSKKHDLVQVCDLFSGALNSRTAQACGERKAELAKKIWLPTHCREWLCDLAKHGKQKRRLV